MSEALVWWILAGGAVAAELLTGTFYLLVLALGLAAGAVAAHVGLPGTWQLTIAGVVGAGAVTAWHQIRSRRMQPVDAAANPDVNMDVGSTVHVSDASQWQADGSIAVKYRGAVWNAQLAPGARPQAGAYVIEQVHGNLLLLRNA